MNKYERSAIVFIVVILAILGALSAKAQVDPAPEPAIGSACNSGHQEACYANQLYLAHTPRNAHYGSIFGTAFCRSTGDRAPGVTVYFIHDDTGTWGIANGLGQFVIIRPVGTVGYFEWMGTVLTGPITVNEQPQHLYFVLGC